MLVVKPKRDIWMLCMEEMPTIRNSDVSVGALVKFKYLDKVITGNMRSMCEGTGIVVSSKGEACTVSMNGKLVESYWIVEIIRSV